MKKLVLSCLFMAIFISAYSQDTVYVRGYFVARYLKSDIMFIVKNQRLKEAGKSYSWKYDYDELWNFYFPLQVDSVILNTKESVETIFLSNLNYRNTDVFDFYPDNNIDDYFRKFNLPIGQIKFPPASEVPYYATEEDVSHLYRIYNVEGWALRVKVKNCYQESMDFQYFDGSRRIDSRSKMNLNIPSFYAYVFYKCDVIRGDLPFKGFVEWNPDEKKRRH